MIHRMRLARRVASILGLSLSLALGSGLPAHAAQKQDQKRQTTSKVAAKSGKQLKQKQVAQRKKVTLSAKAARKNKTLQAQRKNSKTLASAKRTPVASASLVRTSASAPSRVSYGESLGLHDSTENLKLSSNSVLVMDQNTQEVLFSKNDKAVLPIASLTKLMTGLLVADAQLPMDEVITITQDDVDTIKGSSSRLAVGTTLTRGEAMHLALMSSENRAAHALGRTYPGGLNNFVGLMNRKAAELGMRDTRYVEPTGLSSQNQSSAQDLARLVAVAHQRPLLRELTTSPSYEVVSTHNRVLQYRNSNRLIEKDEWNIGLQKTGYISEAGRCLVMQASVAGRQLIMVFLDAAGKAARLGDAERVRHWVERSVPAAHSGAQALHRDRV